MTSKYLKHFFGPRGFWAIVIVVLYGSHCGSNCGPDEVFFGNPSNNEVGILVDGLDTGTSSDINDQSFTTNTESVEVGELDSSITSNALIAFNENRALTILDNANWSPETNIRTVTFPDAVELPIAVWVVYGDYTVRSLQAIYGLDEAWLIFTYDAVGLDLTLVNLTDATGFANISNYYDFTETSDPEDWKNGVGYTPNALNIYMVHTVDGETWKARGVNFRDVIVFGETAVEELFVHEIGHCLNLRHTDTDAVNFDSTNVMWPLSDLYARDQLTEGQIFRMHADVNSSLNWWINARPGLPQYDCPHATTDADCPVIYKRIWADNTFPPN